MGSYVLSFLLKRFDSETENRIALALINVKY